MGLVNQKAGVFEIKFGRVWAFAGFLLKSVWRKVAYTRLLFCDWETLPNYRNLQGKVKQVEGRRRPSKHNSPPPGTFPYLPPRPGPYALKTYPITSTKAGTDPSRRIVAHT